MASYIINSLELKNHDYKISFIPSSKKSYKEKGFIPSKLIAKEIGKLYKIELIDIFENISEKRQTQVKLQERIKNIENKIILKNNPPENIIIIDDVYTTGSTFNEIIKVVKPFNSNFIGLTIAKGVYN